MASHPSPIRPSAGRRVDQFRRRFHHITAGWSLHSFGSSSSRFTVILLGIDVVTGRLPPRLVLISHPIEGAKGGLSVADIFPVAIVLSLHMVVGLVEKPDQADNLVSGAELADGAE